MVIRAIAGLRTRQGWATKAGSYEVTPSKSVEGSGGGRRIVRRPAPKVRQPNSGSGRPRGSGLAGSQVAVGRAGCVALEAADDLGLGQSFLAAPGDVGAG